MQKLMVKYSGDGSAKLYIDLYFDDYNIYKKVLNELFNPQDNFHSRLIVVAGKITIKNSFMSIDISSGKQIYLPQ